MNPCPLTPALRELLQACVTHHTTKARELARALNRSPETIRTEFKRICRLLGESSRSGAVIRALENGWIQLTPAEKQTGVE